MPAPAEDAPFPERIGQYRVLGLLGKGGMGAVFEAEQESPRRTVALKVLSVGTLNDEMRRRFELEAQVLGLLQHACIAQVYEAGVFEIAGGAQPFFAMELIRGVPLVQYANEHGLDTRARLELFARICDGVQHAHQRGVIHRDLKPDNILVDGDGQPKILDFGLARATDSDVQAASLHTNVGQIMGTIPYMSPEQALGDPARIDTRSDVYSLGVVAYELVSGQMPYPANDPAVIEALRVVREEDARPLSSVNRSLRGDVETIIGKALEKEPERRYATVADLASDLRRHLNDEPITARPPSAGYQLRKFARRNRALVAGVAAVFVALVIGLIGTARGYIAAAANAERAQSAADFFQTILTGVDPAVAQGADSTLLRSILDDTATRIDSELEGQPLVAATIHETMATTYYQISKYESALEQARAAHALYARELGPDSLEALGVQRVIGSSLGGLNRTPEAQAELRDNLERIERALGPEHEAADHTRFVQGMQYLDQYDYENAALVFERVVAYRRERFEPDSEPLLVALNGLGITHMARWHLDEAEPLLEGVLESRERVSGPDHPDTIKALLNLAFLHYYRERFDECEVLRREALERADRIFPPGHDVTLETRHALGQVLVKLQRHDEALELQRSVFEKRLALHGPDDGRTLLAEDALAKRYRTSNQLEQALEHAQHATDGLIGWFGPEHESTLSARATLATLLDLTGKDLLAETMRLDLIEVLTRVAGPDDPDTLMVLSDLAATYRDAGRYAEAEALLVRALEGQSRALGEDHSDTILTVGILARTVYDQDRLDEALPLFARFLVGWPRLYGDDHAYVQSVARRMGTVLGRVEQLGPHEAAIRALLEYHRRTLPADSSEITKGLFRHAEALAELERTDEARAVLRELSERYASSDEPLPTEWTSLAVSTNLVSLEEAEATLAEAWEDALDSNPEESLRIALLLVELFEDAGRPDDAVLWREEAEALAE